MGRFLVPFTLRASNSSSALNGFLPACDTGDQQPARSRGPGAAPPLSSPQHREITSPPELIHAKEHGERPENIRMTSRSPIRKREGEQPMEHQLAEIRQRLERAERELQTLRARSRRLRWLAGFVIVGGIAFMLTQPTARQVQAEQVLRGRAGTEVRAPFMVLDDAGRPLLQVGTHLLGRGMLLFDAGGKVVCG